MGLLLVPTATKNLRRMWAFPSILLLSIVMSFLVDLSIQHILTISSKRWLIQDVEQQSLILVLNYLRSVFFSFGTTAEMDYPLVSN